jgi:hypothetical protein
LPIALTEIETAHDGYLATAFLVQLSAFGILNCLTAHRGADGLWEKRCLDRSRCFREPSKETASG